MKVLLLTPRPNLFSGTLEQYGDTYEVSMAAPDFWPEADFVVSFGYRHIIRIPFLEKYEDRIINIHMGLLPWNRGADPNFWSWFDGTPKGVSVHLVDDGIDMGDVIMQMEITKWREQETLKSSYEFLTTCTEKLFALEWSRFRRQNWFFMPQLGAGSAHRSADKDPWMKLLPLGWESPVLDVERLGEGYRAQQDSGALQHRNGA